MTFSPLIYLLSKPFLFVSKPIFSTRSLLIKQFFFSLSDRTRFCNSVVCINRGRACIWPTSLRKTVETDRVKQNYGKQKIKPENWSVEHPCTRGCGSPRAPSKRWNLLINSRRKNISRSVSSEVFRQNDTWHGLYRYSVPFIYILR